MIWDEHKRELLNAAPDRLRPLIEGGYYTIFPDEEDSTDVILDESAPWKLPEKHISDVTVLPDREALLVALPQGGTVAEVGVAEGKFSEKIHSISKPSTLYLVDSWATERYGEPERKAVEERFSEEIEIGAVCVLRKQSETALNEFEDRSLDWVYIDTDHSYEQTAKELELSRRKVMTDGFIAGHDYCIGNPETGTSYGVIRAVHEFCIQYDWRIAYLTLETYGYSSFALTKLMIPSNEHSSDHSGTNGIDSTPREGDATPI